MKNTCILICMLFCCSAAVFQACKRSSPMPSPAPAGITDDELFKKALDSGYSFYQDNPDTLLFTPNAGGHSDFIRVLFNPIAKGALGSDGKLPVGKTFPDGSTIVKEIYKKKGGPLYAVSIMYKQGTDPQAAQGWVWGEYYADRRIVAPAKNKGSQCTGCHSTTAGNSPVPSDQGNRDFVRTFGIR